MSGSLLRAKLSLYYHITCVLTANIGNAKNKMLAFLFCFNAILNEYPTNIEKDISGYSFSSPAFV